MQVKIIGLFLLLALTSCGNKNTSANQNPNATNSPIPVPYCDTVKAGNGPKIGIIYDAEIGSQYNQAAQLGLKRAVASTKGSCKEVSGVATADKKIELTQLAKAGYDPIIAVGFNYSKDALAVAKKFPKAHFAVVEGITACLQEATACAPKKPQKNLVDLVFSENQGSYLMGVVAAQATKTKQIGFVGGTKSFLTKKYLAGYLAGAAAVNPQVKVKVKFLTADPDDVVAGMANPKAGKAATKAMIKRGVDVVYAVAGNSNIGVGQAAVSAKRKVRLIGADADWASVAPPAVKSLILTSMLKKVDVAVQKYSVSVDRKAAVAGTQYFTLKQGGVSYTSTNPAMKKYQPKVESFIQSIIAGKIKVPLLTPADSNFS